MPSPNYPLRIRRGDPIDFYRQRAPATPSTPVTADGISIVSGNIAKESLRERLAIENIPPTISENTTIEDLAQTIVEVDRNEPVSVLSQSKRKRAIRDIFDAATNQNASSLLATIADRLPWEETDVIEGFDAEFVEYHRATNAGTDHDDLLDAIDAVEPDEPHAAAKTRQYVTAFKELDAELDNRLDATTYPTRNHMVRDAAAALDATWHDCYPNLDWVAMSTISVLDNPTLSLITGLAALPDGPEFHLFVGAGTQDYFVRRLKAAEQTRSVTVEDETPDNPPALPTTTGSNLLKAAEAHDPDSFTRSDLAYIEAPDQRREIEQALLSVQQDLEDDENDIGPQDLLVIGREALPYQTAAHDVYRLHNLPTHVEARQETQYMAAYDLMESIFEVFAKPTNEDIAYKEFLRPVLAGLSLPSSTDDWPIPDEVVRKSQFHIYQQRPQRLNTAPVDTWVNILQTVSGIDSRLQKYADWVEYHRANPPSADVLESLLEDCIDAYIDDTLPGRDGEVLGGIAVQPNRVRATEKSPEYYAKRIQNTATAVGEHFEWNTTLQSGSVEWEEALTAFSGIVGDSDYGLPNENADAIRVVDAGNAFFRQTKKTYIMGLSSETFPTTSGDHTYIHEKIRTGLRALQDDDNYPYLYLDCDAAQHERDLDMFEASLRTATEELVLLRPYKDQDNRTVPRSPFLDACDLEDAKRRLSLDELLPTPDSDAGEDWQNLWPSLSRKDRLRILMHYSGGETAISNDAPTQQDMADLARYLKTDDATDEATQLADHFDQFLTNFQEAN